MSSRRKFKCQDCEIDTGKIDEYYMVINSIWQEAKMRRGMLCIGCLEERIGRRLKSTDFTDCYLNNLRLGSKSQRLLNRLKDLPNGLDTFYPRSTSDLARG